MAKTFISYRRDDSLKIVRHIHARLEAEFGDENVFWDKRDLLPGQQFPSELYEAIIESDVFLAVIGKEWCNARDSRLRRRLSIRSDFVRLEIETALRKKKRVIPVLVNGASMPQMHQLPKSLQALAYRQGVVVRNDLDHFQPDMDLLIQQVRDPSGYDYYDDETLGGFQIARRTLPWELLVMLIFVLIVSMALVFVAFYRFNGFSNSSSDGTDVVASPTNTPAETPMATITLTPSPEPTRTPALEPSPTVIPTTPVAGDGRVIRLLYDRNMLVVVNESDRTVDVSHLRFEQTYDSGVTRVFYAREWDNIDGIVIPTSVMRAGGCYILVTPNGIQTDPSRSVCASFLGYFRTWRNDRYFWWTIDPDAIFTVWSDESDALIAECAIAAGECEFVLVQ